MVDAGIIGRISDGGVLGATAFGRALSDNKLKIPEPTVLANSDKTLPFVFIGDDAFALTKNFMKSYAQTGLTAEQRIFNYRLSRARRIVENTFGILVSVFGVFQRPNALSPEKARIITLACCYLHNYLRRKQSNTYIDKTTIDIEDQESGNIIQGAWRVTAPTTLLQTSHSRNPTMYAKYVRDNYCHYFNNEGQVAWQNKFA